MEAPKLSHESLEALEVGFDIPALPGMDAADIQTPALVIDLDALERNIRKMGAFAKAHHMHLRVHAKTHKSLDIAKLQIEIGNATGICCQKVSEAEVFARGGIRDVMITNQIRDLTKIDRLARLPTLGARVLVCLDDPANVADLSAAAIHHGTLIECLVEIDCGAERCGVTAIPAIVEIARAIVAAPALKFGGLHAYQGAMQHLHSYGDREAKIDAAVAMVKKAVAALTNEGMACQIVTGGGTGRYPFEAASGVYNELQCGSYAFMDADYGRLLDRDGRRLDSSEWENALFLLTSVMSHPKPDKAVCDAGLKVQSVDSGLPVMFGRQDVTYVACSDEHGVIDDPQGLLRVNEKLRLVPGHCDPTCNITIGMLGCAATRSRRSGRSAHGARHT